MPIFVATYEYPAETAARREENKLRHRDWLEQQVEAGHVLTVGPFLDGGGALLLVRADTAEATRHLLEQDPHCTEGLVSAIDVREWKPVFGAFA